MPLLSIKRELCRNAVFWLIRIDIKNLKGECCTIFKLNAFYGRRSIVGNGENIVKMKYVFNSGLIHISRFFMNFKTGYT